MKRLALLLAIPFAACSSDPEDDAGPRDSGPAVDATADSGVDGGVVNDAGNDGGPGDIGPGDIGPTDSGICIEVTPPDPTPDPNCAGTWVTVVSGNLEAVDGTPIVDGRAQVCFRSPTDVLRCLVPARTCAAGAFDIIVNELPARCVEHGVMRMIFPNGGFAPTYCPMPLTGAPEINLTPAFKLYETHAPTTYPPLGDGAAMRTVVFEGGLQLDITPNDMASDYLELEGRKMGPADPAPCFLEGLPAPTGLWAFSVEGDISGIGAPIRFPNATNLPANSTVRTFVLGGLDCTLANGDLVTEGEWREYGNATVSADGTVIEGARLPCLTWFGYQP